MKKIHLFALLLFFFAQLSYAASFDCAKAVSATEKMICNDPAISKLDEQLASSYKLALESAKDKDALKTQQKNWLKQKRNVCANQACIKNVYEARNKEIQNRLDEESQFSSSQLSPEIPNFYFGKYRTSACLEEVEEKMEWKCVSLSWSNIDITRRDNESAFFTVNTRNPGGHGCKLSGVARIKDGFLIGSGKANFGEGVCTLTFKSESESLTIEQQDEQCGAMPLCGYGDTFTEGKVYKKY